MERTIQRGDLLAKLLLFERSFPLARPRVNTSKQVYQPLSNQQSLISEMERYSDLHLDGFLWIDVAFYFRKMGKWEYPVSPSIGDLDNHVKGLLDNLQRLNIITNDRFIVGIHATKAWSTEDYVEVEIYGVNQ
jgi:Holliday junction resolvase RusA-like endonuclease